MCSLYFRGSYICLIADFPLLSQIYAPWWTFYAPRRTPTKNYGIFFSEVIYRYKILFYFILYVLYNKATYMLFYLFPSFDTHFLLLLCQYICTSVDISCT
uniref:Uncharacterized protein n=1 Tax=Cacopsylla melanoneura TaxID=428564 RepID=A0A8D8Z7N8_9HEMI